MSLGRLVLKVPLSEFLARVIRDEHFEVLQIRQDHAVAVARLAKHHRDPFDRMLVAQAQVEDLALVSPDRTLAKYGVELIW